MPIDEAIQGELKQKIRDALGQQYSTYEVADIERMVEKTWSSHHAHFARTLLMKEEKGEKKTHKVVAKRYFFMEDEGDLMYGITHSPDFLFGRELRNLLLIRQTLGKGYVPMVLGSAANSNIIVMEYLEGSNHRKKLIEISHRLEDIIARGEDQSLAVDSTWQAQIAEIQGERNKLLYEGVRYLARFVGSCNRRRQNLLEKHPAYENESDMLYQAGKLVLKENLLRVTCQMNPAFEGKQYTRAEVEKYLKEQKDVDIDEELNSLWEMTGHFGTRKIFQHGDFNAEHLIKGKVIDLEKFGLSDETEDISSLLIVVALGNNAIIKSSEFPHLLNRYLAFEYAYENNPVDVKTTLEKANNGDFKQYLAAQTSITQQQYSNFVLSFFAHAIHKNIQLQALQGRTGGGGGNSNDLKELFGEVTHFDQQINYCSEPEQVRQYFYRLGNLLSTVGVVDLSEGILESLRNGTVAGRVYRELPDFKK